MNNLDQDRDAKLSSMMEGRNSFVCSLGSPCFSKEQISELIALVDSKAEPAEIGHAKSDYLQGNADLRRSSVVWLAEENYPWVYSTLREIAKGVNANYYMYDIADYDGPVQIACYDETNQGHFGWHMDTLPSDMSRKISISIPLNNGDEYQGGELDFNTGNIVNRINQLAGVPVTFPSWLTHRVTPVTQGKRYSMVAWVLGPHWR